MLEILRKNFLFFLLAIGAVFYIEYLTPMHSDDFSYINVGLNFKAHLYHYLHWSGRIVADYISGAILLIGNKYIISLLISVAVATMCFMIADMPRVILGRQTSRLAPIFIFTAYWACNTNLGQTTFWVVGASNYLWTNFLIVSFLYFFFIFRDTENIFIKISLFILSILSGCTNENTSITLLCLFSTILLIHKYYYHEKIKFSYILYLFGIFIGACILLLCPGNYARAKHEAFAYWRNATILQKISMHYKRVVSGSKYFIPLLSFIALSGVLKLKKERVSPSLVWSSLFFAGAVLSLVVMGVSPSMPPRAFNGTLVLLLISSSFLIVYPSEKTASKIISLLFTAILIFLFLRSFIFMVASYNITRIQAEMRNSHIEYCRDRGITDIHIPGYHFPRLASRRDMFDMYHSESMGKYFGVKHVEKYDVEHDYSVIRTGRRIQSIDDKFNVVNRILYKNYSVIIRNGYAAIEIDIEKFNTLQNKYQIEIHIDNKKYEYSKNSIFLNGKQYLTIRTGKNKLSENSVCHVAYLERHQGTE